MDSMALDPPRPELIDSRTARTAPAMENNKLPPLANLTQGVPPPSGEFPHKFGSGVRDSMRDSGNWSMQSPSSHSSMISMGQITLPPIDANRPSPNRSSSDHFSFSPRADNNPSPVQNPLSPNVTSPLSTLRRPEEVPSRPNSEVLSSVADSRRSSFDTRLGGLSLNNNNSQTSLASSLQRERGILQDGSRPNSYNYSGARYMSGHSTLSNVSSMNGTVSSIGRNTERIVPVRTAPPIVQASRYPYPHANAENPTKGLPWAFPDPDAVETKPEIGRRDSIESGYSALSSVSSLQPNPARLSEQERPYTSHAEPPRVLNHAKSTNDIGSLGVHHHQMRNKQLEDIMAEPDSPTANTPYSRTPELRITHKLAERKRRKEMKELFDELRDAMPQERGGKTSKWEVLTRAIEHIHETKRSERAFIMHQENQTREIDHLRQENTQLQAMRREMEALRQEVQDMRSTQQNYQLPTPPQAYPQSQPAPAHNPPPVPHSERPTSPPAQKMQGIEY